jgi:hypothetical protein
VTDSFCSNGITLTRSKQGGKINQVYAYNAQNVKIGSAGKQTMAGNGDFLSFTVDQDVPGSQGQYIGISNSNDATCIAWITVQMHDNSQNGVWTGDIGRSYVQTVYYHVYLIQTDNPLLDAARLGSRAKKLQVPCKMEPHTVLPAPGSTAITTTISLVLP